MMKLLFLSKTKGRKIDKRRDLVVQCLSILSYHAHVFNRTRKNGDECIYVDLSSCAEIKFI